jgi:hypothetical protein
MYKTNAFHKLVDRIVFKHPMSAHRVENVEEDNIYIDYHTIDARELLPRLTSYYVSPSTGKHVIDEAASTLHKLAFAGSLAGGSDPAHNLRAGVDPNTNFSFAFMGGSSRQRAILPLYLYQTALLSSHVFVPRTSNSSSSGAETDYKLNLSYYRNTRLASILLNHYHTFFDEDEVTNNQMRKLRVSCERVDEEDDGVSFVKACLAGSGYPSNCEGSACHASHAPLHSSWLQSMQWLRRQLVETSTNSDLPIQNLLFKHSLLVHNTFEEASTEEEDDRVVSEATRIDSMSEQYLYTSIRLGLGEKA